MRRMLPRRAVLEPIVLGLLLLPWGLAAQAPTARLATITTDTGAFAPGHRDFARYTTPMLCLTMARLTQATFRRSLTEQLKSDTLQEDTVGLGKTAPLVRACGARFTIANTQPRALETLFDLALFEDDAPLAQAVLTTMVARAPTRAARIALWETGLSSYLRLGWRGAGAALLAQVDALGPDGQLAQAELHFIMLHAYEARMQSGGPADTVAFRAEVERVLQLIHAGTMKEDGERYGMELYSFKRLMEMMFWEHPDSIPALALRIQRALDNDQPWTATDHDWQPWRTFTTAQVIERLLPRWANVQQLRGVGETPRLQADFWFPPPGQPASDTVRPVPGKVNLICLGGWLSDFVTPGTEDRFNVVYPQLRRIRRWLARYGADHLAVTLVWPAEGYTYYDFFPLNMFRLFQTPAEEAQFWRWYVQEYAQVPVTVAVQVRHQRWLPAPDGRRLPGVKIQFNAFWQHEPEEVAYFAQSKADGAPEDSIYGSRPGERSDACTIVGRDGTIVADFNDNHDDPVGSIEGVLRWLFQGPDATSSAARGPTPGARAGAIQ